MQLVPIDAIPEAEVERLLDRAFGTDRHARTAYLIRAGMTAIPHLSVAAVEQDVLLGTLQCWPCGLTRADGSEAALVMVGPVAVEPARQQGGIGRLLTLHALAVADGRDDTPPLMLIGDPEYYGRFFGFSAAHTAGWRAPGPVERHRLLARGATVPIGPGILGPRRAPPA